MDFEERKYNMLSIENNELDFLSGETFFLK